MRSRQYIQPVDGFDEKANRRWCTNGFDRICSYRVWISQEVEQIVDLIRLEDWRTALHHGLVKYQFEKLVYQYLGVGARNGAEVSIALEE